MNLDPAHRPTAWAVLAAIGLLAATLAFAWGAQALDPPSAAALQTDICDDPACPDNPTGHGNGIADPDMPADAHIDSADSVADPVDEGLPDPSGDGERSGDQGIWTAVPEESGHWELSGSQLSGSDWTRTREPLFSCSHLGGVIKELKGVAQQLRRELRTLRNRGVDFRNQQGRGGRTAIDEARANMDDAYDAVSDNVQVWFSRGCDSP
jgi:hypothetical protein